MYTYPFFHKLPSHLVCHIILNRVPCAFIYYFRITLPFMKLNNVWHFCHLNQISLIFTDLQYETSILILVPAAHSVTIIYSSFLTSFIHYFLCPCFLPSSVIDCNGQQLPKKHRVFLLTAQRWVRKIKAQLPPALSVMIWIQGSLETNNS